MIINDPGILAEVQDAFDRYETALLANDGATLDAMFVAAPETVRYGVSEIQYGIDEIRAFRAIQQPFIRTLERLVITTYGDAVATASTLFHRPDFPGQVGRQMQTWIKQDGSWRVAAAHVSMMAMPA
ncbi:oxalurate catabolism protein HpxZ [Devosia beringensis]|uniref:oxalurate catabolism protein HpxZ n=1 Tax=Devosia beringensis TaxID=2657486 RepID=UPI00186B9DE6|nr:oxalurate catabolism protein HpxZ [Devosia beringensis]